MAQNFNLVSPQNNGYRYNCNFGTEIVIEENSSCYLNFAQLSRESNVHIVSDQTITVTGSGILPQKLVADDGTVEDATFTGTATIKSGFYKPQALQEAIKKALIEVIDQDGVGIGRGALMDSIPDDFLGPFGLDVPLQDIPELININMSANRENWGADPAMDTDNQFNVKDPVRKIGGKDAYEKKENATRTVTRTYDNYTILQHPIGPVTFSDNSLCDINTGAISGGYVTSVPAAEKLDTGAWMGFLGKHGASLANQSGATPPATIGTGSAPVLRTVQFPASVVRPGLTNTSDMTGINPDPFFPASFKSPETFYEGFKLTITEPSGGHTESCICLPVIGTPVANSAGVKSFVGTSGSMAGLVGDVDVELTQKSSSGGGSGFKMTARTTALGGLTPAIVADSLTSIILAPGGRAVGGYEVGDTIELEDAANPGAGNIVITVTELAQVGVVDSLLFASQTACKFQTTITTRFGKGFVGATPVRLTQLENADQIQTTSTTDATVGSSGLTASISVPQCYVGLQFNGQGTRLPEGKNKISVYMVQTAAGKTPKDETVWTSQNVALGGMKKLATFDYELGGDYKNYGIQFYIREYDRDQTEPRIYFRAVQVKQNDLGFTVLYDSATDDEYFNYKFLIGTPITTKNEMLLQFPFSPMLSVQTAKDNQLLNVYAEYDQTARSAGASSIKRPLAVQRVTLDLSSDLSQIIGGPSISLYPQGISVDRLSNFTVSNVVAPISNASYYIVIEELPLRNYKNKKDVITTGDGNIKKGYVKNILANVPLPFEAVSSQVNKADGTTFLTGLYQPPQKIRVGLLNQRISTNQMSVRIFRMDDDTEANELITSVVNFTIDPPTEKIEDI